MLTEPAAYVPPEAGAPVVLNGPAVEVAGRCARRNLDLPELLRRWFTKHGATALPLAWHELVALDDGVWQVALFPSVANDGHLLSLRRLAEVKGPVAMPAFLIEALRQRSVTVLVVDEAGAVLAFWSPHVEANIGSLPTPTELESIVPAAVASLLRRQAQRVLLEKRTWAGWLSSSGQHPGEGTGFDATFQYLPNFGAAGRPACLVSYTSLSATPDPGHPQDTERVDWHDALDLFSRPTFLLSTEGLVREHNTAATEAYGGGNPLNGRRFEEVFPPPLGSHGWRGMVAFARTHAPLLVHLDGAQGPVRGACLSTEDGLLVVVPPPAESAHVALRTAASEVIYSKEDFIALVSHELRTPLNIVLGFAELLRTTALSGDQQRYLTTLETGAQDLLHLINECIEYVRLDHGPRGLLKTIFRPAELVRTTLEPLYPRFEASGMTVSLQLPHENPEVAGDERRITLVLRHLLENVSKFSGGTHVTLSLELLPPPAADSPSREMVLVVEDNGVGISPELLRRLGEPFTVGEPINRRRRGGLGLGLPICRTIAHRLGGKLTLERNQSGGTRAAFFVPVGRAEIAASGTNLAQIASQIRVLVVDDELANRTLMELVLQRLGFRPVVVSNGAQALALANERPFDLGLLDIMMPGMDGVELARRWREAEASHGFPRAILVAVTALDTAQRQDLLLDFDSVLEKPVRRDVLATALTHLLAS